MADTTDSGAGGGEESQAGGGAGGTAASYDYRKLHNFPLIKVQIRIVMQKAGSLLTTGLINVLLSLSFYRILI